MCKSYLIRKLGKSSKVSVVLYNSNAEESNETSLEIRNYCANMTTQLTQPNAYDPKRPFYQGIFTIQYPVPLFSLCTKSLIAVLKDAKQLSEENGGGPFC